MDTYAHIYAVSTIYNVYFTRALHNLLCVICIA